MNISMCISNILIFLGLTNESVVVAEASIDLLKKVVAELKNPTLLELCEQIQKYIARRIAYEEAIEADSRPFRRSRLMIVGEGAAGKSSFLRALTKQPFVKEHNSTVGALVKDMLSKAGAEVGDYSNWVSADKYASENDRTLCGMIAVGTVGKVEPKVSTVTESSQIEEPTKPINAAVSIASGDTTESVSMIEVAKKESDTSNKPMLKS